MAGSHQRSWMWGRHAVNECLQADRWPVLELMLADDLPFEELKHLTQLASQRNFKLETAPAARLTQLCGSAEHQGFIARMAEFPAGDSAAWHAFLTQTLNSETSALPPLFVICERIQDAHNFGAILRSCDGVGAAAVVVESTHQAAVTPHVARSSAGAVNYLNLYRADDLVHAVGSLQELGVRVVAANEKSQVSVWQADLSGPIALIVGSEAYGIRPELLQLCNAQIAIPMQGSVRSLNAAVAAGILLYEIRRQQTSRTIDSGHHD